MFSATLMGSWFDLGIIQTASVLRRVEPSPAAIPACKQLITRNKGRCWDDKITSCDHLLSYMPVSGWCCPGWGDLSGVVSCSRTAHSAVSCSRTVPSVQPEIPPVTPWLIISLCLYGTGVLECVELWALASEAV